MNDIADLNELKDAVSALRETTSLNEKVAIIKQHPTLESLFQLVYNEQIQFGVTSKNCKKIKKSDPFKYESVYQLFNALALREITGHDAIGQINGFISKYPEFEEVVYLILDKDLKTRTDASLINKAFPGMIPTFDVALAKIYEDERNKVNFTRDVWFASRKLDGLRLITIVDANGKPRFWSRTGKEYTTLSVLGKEIESLHLVNVVFDGELCQVDETGLESFKDIIKLARKKDYTIENPCYLIFDTLTPTEFFDKKSLRTFSDRHYVLATLFQTFGPFNHMRMVEQVKVKDLDHLEELRNKGREGNWEGLVLRKDVPYEGKRTTNLLKVKDFERDDFLVTGLIRGPFRMVDNGKEVEIETLSAVTIDYKGYTVNVGSGFTLEERMDFFNNPDKIVGKRIEVKYKREFNESDKGGLSIQFPIYCGLWGDDRDA